MGHIRHRPCKSAAGLQSHLRTHEGLYGAEHETLDGNHLWRCCNHHLYLYIYVEVLREFRKRFRRKRPALFKSGQWHFHKDTAPVHNSSLFTDYLTKMGIKTIPHPPYSLDLAPCDFCLFPKLRGCRYETIEEMKEVVTKVIDMLTQEDLHVAFQKLLERYKCIAAGGDNFEGD